MEPTKAVNKGKAKCTEIAFRVAESAGVLVEAARDSEQELANALKTASSMKTSLAEMLDAERNDGRLAEMMENLKRKVNEAVDEAQALIANNKLLDAHMMLMELENFRDEQLMALSLLNSNAAQRIKERISTCFDPVESLQSEMAKQVWLTCSRALQHVRGHDNGSVELVNAIRIIEREERRDAHYQELEAGYKSLGRPRRWKEKLFAVLSRSVQDRIDGSGFAERSESRESWIAKNLEMCGRLVAGDLQEVRRRLTRCFPPHYDIYRLHLGSYHEAVAAKVEEMAALPELGTGELLQLLSWVHTYPERIIKDELAKERPLLRDIAFRSLCEQFVLLVKKDVHDYLDKLQVEEKERWRHVDTGPEKDGDRHAYIQLPKLLFDLIDDKVALARRIAPQLVPAMINALVDELHPAGEAFANSVLSVCRRPGPAEKRDRALARQLNAMMTAIANGFDQCTTSTHRLAGFTRYEMEELAGESEHGPYTYPKCNFFGLSEKIDALEEKWKCGRENALTAMCDEMSHHIASCLEKLGTTEWLEGSESIAGRLAQMTEECCDYTLLRPHVAAELSEKLLNRMAANMVSNVCSQRPRPDSAAGPSKQRRMLTGRRLREEACRLVELFGSRTGLNQQELPIIPAFTAIAEIIECDEEMVSLTASSFVKSTGIGHGNTLTSIIESRGDMSTKQARKRAMDASTHATGAHPSCEMSKLMDVVREMFA